MMGDLEMKLVIGLHRNVLELDRQTARLALKERLTLGQFAVLEALYSKGDQSISAVRERILSSVGTISVIVKNLERRGLIQRLSDENDRRVCLISLTREGYEVISRIVPDNKQMIEHYFSVLTAEEKQEMKRLMRKIGGVDDGAQN